MREGKGVSKQSCSTEMIMNKTQIAIPPIEVWQDESGWNWTAPGGASGSHEKSFRNAALCAINGARIEVKDFKIEEPVSTPDATV